MVEVLPSILSADFAHLADDVAAAALFLASEDAAYISGTLVEGIGQLGVLETLSGGAISTGNQNALMAAAKTATAVVQTLDFQGDKVNAATAKSPPPASAARSPVRRMACGRICFRSWPTWAAWPFTTPILPR